MSEPTNKEEFRRMLDALSDEKLQDFLTVIQAFASGDYSSMPKSYWEFVLQDEKASEETKEKARIALAKKRGEAK